MSVAKRVGQIDAETRERLVYDVWFVYGNNEADDEFLARLLEKGLDFRHTLPVSTECLNAVDEILSKKATYRDPRVILSPDDVLWAKSVGRKRHKHAIRDGKHDAHGLKADYKDGLAIHEEGAAAELAYCRFRGIEWPATVDTYKKPDVGKNVQIRNAAKRTDRLIVREVDPDDEYYVLVIGRIPDYKIVGWIRGRDAKQDWWRRTWSNRPPAYFVPQEALNGF